MALRDPRAIAWSCFTQYLPDNAESAGFNTLETAVMHVESQLRFWLQLRDRLPAGIWHESRYEGMVGGFETEVHGTLDFLGLPWDPGIAEFHTNPSPVRSPTYAEATLPVYRHAVEKWRNYEPFLAGKLDNLSPLAGELGYAIES
jgi:hypothetical protein